MHPLSSYLVTSDDSLLVFYSWDPFPFMLWSTFCTGVQITAAWKFSLFEQNPWASIGGDAVQYLSKASTEVPELEKSSLNSPPKHDIEVSADCKEEHATATREAKVADADSGCVSLNSTSFTNTPLHFSEAIKHPSEGNGNSTSGSMAELVSQVKYPLALNAYHVALVGKSLLDPPTGGNIETFFIKDATKVNYCLKTYNRYKLEVSSQEIVFSCSQTQEKSATSPADLHCRALSNESRLVLEMDRPQLDSCVENGVRPSTESGVDY
ncbi:hypothetical protein Ancab_013363 [Ancistrocladus abbreviatus]